MQIDFKSAGEPLLPPSLLCTLDRDCIAGLFRSYYVLLVLPELVFPVRILVFLHRARLPLRPLVDGRLILRGRFVHFCELVEVHQEHMPHLMQHGRFIRTLKERNDTLAVLLRYFTVDLSLHLLIVLFDNGDRLVVEDNIAAAVTAPVVGDALDSSLVEKKRGIFMRILTALLFQRAPKIIYKCFSRVFRHSTVSQRNILPDHLAKYLSNPFLYLWRLFPHRLLLVKENVIVWNFDKKKT